MMTRTAAQMRVRARRLDSINSHVTAVLAEMRTGAALHLEFERNGRESWWLTTRREIAPEIARRVIEHTDLVSVGDALFENVLTQTYRFIHRHERSPT